MTWNLWWRFGGNWREREHGIIETLRGADPDLVGVQEAWGTPIGNQPELLGGALGLRSAFVEPALPPPPVPVEHADQADVTVGVGLLSRWPVLRADAVNLPSTGRDLVALLA